MLRGLMSILTQPIQIKKSGQEAKTTAHSQQKNKPLAYRPLSMNTFYGKPSNHVAEEGRESIKNRP